MLVRRPSAQAIYADNGSVEATGANIIVTQILTTIPPSRRARLGVGCCFNALLLAGNSLAGVSVVLMWNVDSSEFDGKSLNE